MELNDAHALVTGASAGIGRAIALDLARAGARVTLVARRRAALESLAEEILAEGLAAPFVLTPDLADDQVDGADGWLKRARAHAGDIDVLVNNAGVQVIGPTDAVDVEAGERSLRINLSVPLRLTRAVLPAMRAQGAGAIINIASMAALAPTPSMTYYNASKAGLAGASEALRGELRGTGVEVLTVYPGIIDTDMATAALRKYESSFALRLQPRGDVTTLARAVRRSVEGGRARLVYPRVNILARWFPGLTRWTLDNFSPRLTAPVPAGSMEGCA